MRPAAWLRFRLDAALLAAAAVVGLVTWLSGGYQPAPTAEAQSVSLSFYLLLAPAFLWVGATLLAVRGLLALARRLSARASSSSFQSRLVTKTALLSVLRRPRAAASGVIALSLAVAFGMSIALFVRTYQAEKLTDARFVNGADVRVTPTTGQPLPADFSSALSVNGVRGVSAVVSTSSVLVGTEKRAMVAIDPATFPAVAQINPSFLTGITPAQALAALSSDPRAVLIDNEVARTFNIQVGDQVRVQLPSPATGRPVATTFHAVGIYTNFPGFPQGIDFVGSLAGYRAVVQTPTTLYLLDTGGSDSTATLVASELRAGPGRTTPLLIDTISTAVNHEQSTLAALNIDGLGRLETVYTVLLSALGVAIFVFGTLLRRRKEYITLRALGMGMRDLVALVVAEAAAVAVASVVLGGIIGTAMALLFVQILRPLFTIPPAGVTVPAVGVALLMGLVLAAALASSFAAGASLRRTHLVEVLREE
jgi:putative ABC transport system permease protein